VRHVTIKGYAERYKGESREDCMRLRGLPVVAGIGNIDAIEGRETNVF